MILQGAFVALPLCALAYFQKIKLLKILPLFFLFLFIEEMALNILRGATFFHWQWNWQGKFLELIWPLILVFVLKKFTAKEVGYLLPKLKLDWLIGLSLGIIVALIGIVIDKLTANHPDRLTLEGFFFQLSMPGLAEEAVYRGVFLALFNRYFPRPLIFLSAKLGWGAILSSLIFMAVHIVCYLPKEGEIFFNWQAALPTFIMGMVLVWLRERAESIWPSVILHNVANTLYMAL